MHYTITPALLVELFSFYKAIWNPRPLLIKTDDHMQYDMDCPMACVLYPVGFLHGTFVNASFESLSGCLPDILAVVRTHLAEYLVDVPIVRVDGTAVRWRIACVNQPVDVNSPLFDALAKLLLIFEENNKPNSTAPLRDVAAERPLRICRLQHPSTGPGTALRAIPLGRRRHCHTTCRGCTG